MVTIEEARKILQDDKLTDKEVEETINSLQLLVELMFDGWLEEQKHNAKPTTNSIHPTHI